MYAVDIHFWDDDCSYCPCYARVGHDGMSCRAARRALTGTEASYDGIDEHVVTAYPRPEWCPLVRLEHCYVMSHWKDDSRCHMVTQTFDDFNTAQVASGPYSDYIQRPIEVDDVVCADLGVVISAEPNPEWGNQVD